MAQAQRDCCLATGLPPAGTSVTVNLPIPNNLVADDVSCSCLASEGGSFWMAFTCTSSGTLEINVEALAGSEYDFSLWEGTCPCGASGGGLPSSPPPVISCNSEVGGSNFTGIADDPTGTFGVPNSILFNPTVNLEAGKNYYLLLSNRTFDSSNFNLFVEGTASWGAINNLGNLQGPTEVCLGGQATFSLPPVPNVTEYHWWVIPTVPLIATGEPSNTFTFLTEGTFQVCVTPIGPPQPCQVSLHCKEVTVTAFQNPVAYEYGYVCTNDVYVASNGEAFFYGGVFNLVNESWQGCDSITELHLTQVVSNQNYIVKAVCQGDCVEFGGETYCDAGTYDQVLQNQYGCDSTTTLLVVSVPIETNITGAGTLNCNTTSLVLSSSTSLYGSNPVYTWRKGTTVVGTSPSLTVTTGGTYSLTITSKVGDHTCEAESSVTIIQDTAPPQNVVATGGSISCYAAQVVLQGNSTTPGVSYIWTGPNGFVSNQANPTVGTPGNYLLTVTGTNGCTKTATAVVVDNHILPTAVAAASGSLNCNADQVLLNGAGSSTGAQFTYLWSTTNGTISADAATLTPTVTQGGNYLLTVTNQGNGCTSTATATVVQYPPVASQVTGSSDATCFGEANGSATVTASGGDGNLSYQWSSGDSTAAVANLPAGNYTVVVTDGNGCTSSQSVVIGQPTDLVANASATPQTVFGVDNGTASANPSGGTGSYTYAWSNGENTQSITNLAPANYTVVVTDENGCTASQTVTVSPNNCVVKANIDQTNVSCPGAADGAATINLDSATPPFVFAWSNGEATQTVTGLSGGTYDVSVTDANGCEVVATVIIEEPQALSPNATATDLLAYNSNDGMANAIPTGGTAPYSYLWDNGDTTETIADLPLGDYTVVVTDANGCTASQTVTVNQYNCTLSASIVLSSVSCNGAADGQAILSLSGGTAPFTYLWSNGETSASIVGLAAGSYLATATDALGCPAIVSTTLDEPAALDVEVVEMVKASCGASDGVLTVLGTGGTPGFGYLWQNGETTPTVSGLMAGTYTVAITDANGCSNSFDLLLGTDDQVPPMAFTQDFTLVLGPDGQASLAPADVDNGSMDDCAIAAYSLDQTSFTCAHLGDNTVTLTVMDLGGNTANATATVTVVDLAPPVITCPSDLALSDCEPVGIFAATATDLCSSDVTVAQSSGPASGSTFPDGTTLVSFMATDASGNSASCSFNVIVQPAVVAPVSSVDVSCFGENDGSALVSPVGGATPYTYLWSNGDDTPSTSGLEAGQYSVSVTDANGCTVVSTVEIDQPSLIVTTLVDIQNATNNQSNGLVDVTVTGGVPPYTFVWKDLAGNVLGSAEDISGLGAGTFTLFATDANGCVSNSSYTIQNTTSVGEIGLDSRVLLYPNPTADEVVLELVGFAKTEPIRLTAFDITGKQVLQTSGTGSKQYLHFGDKPAGVYLLKIVVGEMALTRRLVVNR